MKIKSTAVYALAGLAMITGNTDARLSDHRRLRDPCWPNGCEIKPFVPHKPKCDKLMLIGCKMNLEMPLSKCIAIACGQEIPHHFKDQFED